jgi:hypothetical protein
MSHRGPLSTALLAFLAVPVSVGAATCSFPEVTLSPGCSGGGTSTTASTGGNGGVGGTTGAAGEVGCAGAGGIGGTTTSTTSTPPNCPVDKDGDMAVSWQCGGGTDCADNDANTHPGITEYSATPIQNEKAPNTDPYDKNCDGTVENETPVLGCAPGHCPAGIVGFKSNVSCGTSAPLGHCEGFVCGWKAENPAMTKTQKCR